MQAQAQAQAQGRAPGLRRNSTARLVGAPPAAPLYLFLGGRYRVVPGQHSDKGIWLTAGRRPTTEGSNRHAHMHMTMAMHVHMYVHHRPSLVSPLASWLDSVLTWLELTRLGLA